MTASSCVPLCAIIPSTPSNKSLRGSRGPEAGVRGIPSPFINLDERGRDTPHPSFWSSISAKRLLDEVVASLSLEGPGSAYGHRIRVAELGADPLVFSAERNSPRSGLHADAVSEAG